MNKVYIGIDAHKATNLIAYAFEGREAPELSAAEGTADADGGDDEATAEGGDDDAGDAAGDDEAEADESA